MSISAAKLLVEVSADTSAAEKGVTAFSNKLDNAAKGMRNVGAGMTAAITLPLVGIAAAGLKSAMQFEQNMNMLQQAVGASAAEMEGLQKQALSLGATTVFSAGEAAEAMLELGKAGMDTEDVMASIEGVMALAAAGGVGLAEAAGLTAAALNAFGLEASESGRIADLFAATANSSAANISDLGQGMKQAGFAFRLADQPIENLAASLAILTNVGLTGSDAGTALKNAFMRMMNPTKEARGLMNELGISFYDANGNMRQLPQIIDMLNNAMSGLTNQQRDAALTTLFLSDGMKAMVPLMEVGAQGFNDLVTEVSATGAASDAADARMKGLAGGIEYLKGSVDSFLIGAALPFLDTLGGLARGAGDLLTQFGELPQPIINAALAIAGVLAVTGPLLLAIGYLAPAFALLNPPLLLLIATGAALAAAWVTNFGDIQTHVGTAMATVQKWFASAALAVQDFGKYISHVVRDGDYLNDWLTHLPSAMQPATQALGQGISVAQDFGRYIALVAKDGDYLNDWLTHLPSGMQSAAQAIGQGISIFQDFGRYIAHVVKDGDYLNDWLTHLPASMQPATQALGEFLNALQGFGPAIATAFGKTKFPSLSELWTDFKAGDFDTLATKIRDTAFNLMVNLNTELNIMGKAEQLRQSIVSGITQALAAAMKFDFSGARTTFNELRSSIQGALTNAFSGISLGSATAELSKIRKSIQGALTTALSGIDLSGATARFSSLAATISTSLSGLASAAKSFDLGAAITDIKTRMNSLRDNILSGLTTALGGVDLGPSSTAFAGLIDKLTSAVEGLDFKEVPWGEVLKTGLIGPIGIAIKGILWVIESASFEGLKTAATGAIGTIKWGDIGTAFVGLGTAISTAMDGLIADLVARFTPAGPSPAAIPPTIIAPETELDVDWTGITIGTVGLVDAVGMAINKADWFKLGEILGAGLIADFNRIGTAIGALNWANEAINSFKAQALGMAANIGFEIGKALVGTDWGKAITGLDEAIKGAIGGVILGFINKIGTEIATAVNQLAPDLLPDIRSAFDSIGDFITTALGRAIGVVKADATSTADILRDQQLGIKAFEWPPLPTWTWPDYTTWTWTDYTAWTWPDYTLWEWPDIPTPAWLASLLSWNPFGGADNGASGVVGGGDLPRMIEDEGQGGRKGKQSLRPPVEAASMEALNWNDYVTALTWETFVTAVEWSSFVSPLTWETFVSGLDWESFVPALSWDSFVTSLSWGSFVERINWGSFITDVSWNNYIPGMDWGVFVQYLDWGRFINSISVGSGGSTSGGAVEATSSVSAAGVSATGSEGVNVTVNASIASDMDVESLALRVARVIQRRIR